MDVLTGLDVFGQVWTELTGLLRGEGGSGRVG